MSDELASRTRAVVDLATDEREEEVRRVAQARRGDPSAIDWLLERYRLRVVRLAAHVLRRPNEAEDVAQEAFVRAFRNLGSYRGDGCFYTWLYQIVVRICLDRRRAARWSSETTALEELSDEYAEGRSALGAVEARVVVEELLNRMSPPMRAILVLRELEGLQYSEIAAVLGIPVGLVRWRLHTARALFRDIWRREFQEDEHA